MTKIYMPKVLSKFRLRANNKLIHFKKKLRKNLEEFKDDFNEKKGQPRSKRKSYLLGFGTVFSIFGLAVFSSSLPVNAQDVPPKPGQPTQVQPAAPKQSDQITKAVAGAAASVCALAVTSGSFLIGAACGLVVVVGILKVQGK
jgi:hypothetical protein